MNPLLLAVPEPWGTYILSACIGIIFFVVVVEGWRADREGFDDVELWAARYPFKARVYVLAFAFLIVLLFLSDPPAIHSIQNYNYTSFGAYQMGNVSLNEAAVMLSQITSPIPNLSVLP